MGQLRRSGTMTLSLQRTGKPQGPEDELLEAVRQTAAGDYEVFGEIGRGGNSTIVYLARDIKDRKLVALKLTRGGMGADDYVLDVVMELDHTIPAFENFCYRCGAPLRQFGRFCGKCGADLGSTTDQRWSADELREAVQEFAEGKFAILGEMATQGGGRIYFARDVASGKVEALRLRKQGGDEYVLGFTGVLKPIVASVAGKDRPSLVPPAIPPSAPHASSDPAQVSPRPPAAEWSSPSPEASVQPEQRPARPQRYEPSLGVPFRPPRQPARRPPPHRPVSKAPPVSLREFIRQPLVMAAMVVAGVLFLLIILALMS